MAEVIVFDVVGTLLDLSPLDSHFKRNFGSGQARKGWFQMLQQLMFASTATDSYADFSKLAKAALQMTAGIQGIRLSSEQRSATLNELKSLPPFPDVEEGLSILRNAGLRLATITNGTLQSARTQLRNAGLADYFEEIMSADEVKRLKPAREPYEMAGKRLKVKIGEVRLVAAHWWDINGAMVAGCATAFISRPDEIINPAAPKPEIDGRDLIEVAHKIIRKDRNN